MTDKPDLLTPCMNCDWNSSCDSQSSILPIDTANAETECVAVFNAVVERSSDGSRLEWRGVLAQHTLLAKLTSYLGIFIMSSLEL